MNDENKRYKKWTDSMLEKFAAVGGKLNGHPTNRLVHNLNIGFNGIESKAIINSVSKKLAISAGSACTTQNVEPSHVLLALGLSEEQSHYAIRIGCGRFNTDEDIETATGDILNSLESLKKIRI
jgi:cysteine desulfurase